MEYERYDFGITLFNKPHSRLSFLLQPSSYYHIHYTRKLSISPVLAQLFSQHYLSYTYRRSLMFITAMASESNVRKRPSGLNHTAKATIEESKACLQ